MGNNDSSTVQNQGSNNVQSSENEKDKKIVSN